MQPKSIRLSPRQRKQIASGLTAAGLSHTAAAEKLGVSRPFIGLILGGQKSAPRDLLVRLAALAGYRVTAKVAVSLSPVKS